MSCDKCNSERLLSVNAKCNDLCHATQHHNGLESDGYSVIGSSGSYVEFTLCMECGKHQGEFPMEDVLISNSEME